MSKISELSDGGAIQSGDTLIAVRSGGNVKVTYGGTTTANIDGGTIDGTVIGGSTPAAGSFTTISASGEIAANGGVAFGDNDKATFGAGSDLQIYHDGSNSRIVDSGTGILTIQASSQLGIYNSDGTQVSAEFVNDGKVGLRYSGSEKLATTATGIDVTGTVTADGGLIGDAVSGSLSQTGMLTVSDTNSANTWTNFTGTAAYLPFSHELAVVNLADATTNSFAGLYFMAGESSAASGISSARIGAVRTGASTADLAFSTRGGSDMNQAMRIAGNGDISFYEDTGTTAKFFWDASAESLGIGTTSPTGIQGGNVLEVSNATGSEVIVFRDDSSTQTNDFCGGFVIGNRDASGTPNHYAGMWADTDSFGQMTLQFAGGRDKYESGTADMVINSSGNVGIGTSSPAKTLDVNGEMQADIYRYPNANVGGIFDISGSNGIEFYGSTNAGANKLVAYTSGSERMRIDSSGNVGIGTTSPATALDVAGTITADGLTVNSGSTNQVAQFESTDSTALISIKDSATSSNTHGIGAVGDNLTLYTNGSEAARIDSAGNVGIGTTSPASALDVAGTVTADGLTVDTATILTSGTNAEAYFDTGAQKYRILNRSSDNTFNFYDDTQSAFRFTLANNGDISFYEDTGTTAKFFWDASAESLGIGTTTPSSYAFNDPAKLVVANTSGNSTLTIASGTSSIGYLAFADGTSGTSRYSGSLQYNHSTNALSMHTTDGSERMRIDSSGNLLVGTTSTDLHTTSTGTGVRIGDRYLHIARNSNPAAIFNRITSDGDIVQFRKDGTNVGSISVTASTTSYNITSDQRLKENITDAPAGNVDDIKVRSFDWKADGTHQDYGMVAQELEAVAPYAVTKGETEDDMWSVDYSKLVPMLIKEIQDLKAEVAALKGA